MKKILVILVSSALLLSGCATLSKDECLTANWYQIGYEDGADGYPDTRIKDHREACAEHGVSPNFNDYQVGHGEGVIKFCTPSNGFYRGKRGYSYRDVCPADLEGDFLKAYNAGKEIHAANSAIRSAEKAQEDNADQISKLEKDIQAKKTTMLAPNTSTERRYALDAEISKMQTTLGALQQKNKQLAIDAATAKANLRTLEAKYSYY